METADRILQFLREMGIGLPPAEQENIATAFREILFNAIEHGGGSDPDKSVNVTYVRTSSALKLPCPPPGSTFTAAAFNLWRIPKLRAAGAC